MKSALVSILWWTMLLGGVAIMAIGVAYSVEVGPTAAPQLWQQKAVARTVLFAGGGTSILGALGLFVTSNSRQRSQSVSAILDSKPKKPIAEL